jgi:hypothetical protein
MICLILLQLFRGAAIQGSTLVTTYGDIRQFAPRGSQIIIDSNVVQLAEKGEWSASRIELSEDYKGSTNLDALIEIPFTNAQPYGSPKKNKAKIVPPGEIIGAISGLEAIKFPTNRLAQHSNIAKQPKTTRAKVSPRAKPTYSEHTGNEFASSRGTYDIRSDNTTALESLKYSPSKSSIAGEELSRKSPYEYHNNETSAMLQELALKEASGYSQKSYFNMHRRLAEEVLEYLS